MTKIYKMIQTKEELFLAELGINTKEEIEFAYGAKIKITDLLKKYETKQLLIHIFSQQRELLSCDCPKCGKEMISEWVKHHHCNKCKEHYTST
jgi:tRNA(Ile2) C34 agmatinyltransferase TiaS